MNHNTENCQICSTKKANEISFVIYYEILTNDKVAVHAADPKLKRILVVWGDKGVELLSEWSEMNMPYSP